MNKRKTNKQGWFYVAMGCLAVSIIALFLPIFQYGSGSRAMTFNIVDLIGGNEDFNKYVLTQYKGPVLWDITGGMAAALAILAVASLLCAVIGLITLRAQHPNKKNFIITMIGFVGILIPSVTAMVVAFGLGKYYPKGFSIGIAPIIAPIAILVCIVVVIRRKSAATREMEKLQKELKEKGLFQAGGEL